MNQQFGCNYNPNKYPLVSNNKFFGYPAIMSDSRSMTDYRSSGYVNNLLRMKYGLMQDYQYREFLQNNAVMLMNENTEYYHNMMNCKDWVIQPVNTTCVYNRNYGKCYTTDPHGIGLRNIGKFN